MATIEEMACMLYDLGVTPITKSRVKESFRRVLCEIEEDGNRVLHVRDVIPCVIWLVYDTEVRYYGVDESFTADKLTDKMMDRLIITTPSMMDDLIIEEV